MHAEHLRIKEIYSPEDRLLSSVVNLHLQTFPKGFISSLGSDFVRSYYEAIVISSQCFLQICFMDNEFSGFISYTTNNENNDILRIKKDAKKTTLKNLIRMKLDPIIILRSIKKMRLSRSVQGIPELLSIAIKPDMRRAGLGRILLSTMESDLINKGCKEYCVHTDNPEGLNFYKKNNLTPVFEFNFAGVTSACFLKKLNV